jgi:hypothetical protein
MAVRVPQEARGWDGRWSAIGTRARTTGFRIVTPWTKRAPSRGVWLSRHAPGSPRWDRRVALRELAHVDAVDEPEPTRDAILAKLAASSRRALEDPDASLEEVAFPADRRFGTPTVQIALLTTGSASRAGAGPRPTILSLFVRFTPPARSIRSCEIWFDERGVQPGPTTAGWREFLTWLSIEPTDRWPSASGAPPLGR